jgi:hypothetical protein
MTELAAVCAQFYTECLQFLSSGAEPPQCDSVFLGPDIGFANVFHYNDADGTCELSIAELGKVCSGEHYTSCMEFLASSEEAPKCDDVFLGPDIGFANVFSYNDVSGDCQLSMVELAAVCSGAHYQQCLDFIQSSEIPPECDPIFLGPDIGFANVFTYNDADGTCDLSMAELATICASHFEECMAFLDSSETEPTCQQVFLGPDIGWQNVFHYNDEDGNCDLSIQELAEVCSGEFFQQCLDFLASAEDEHHPECEPVFLGPDIGFANVFTYSDADGSCHLSMAELGDVCANHFAACIAFLESSEQPENCDPIFLGADIGYANVFEYSDADGTCTLSIAELSAVCEDHFAACIAFLESGEETPQCDAVFLGPDIGYANVFEYNDEDGDCQLSITELSIVCSVHYQQCIDFLGEDLQTQQPVCESVFLGPDIGFANIFSYNDADGTCDVDMTELATVCTHFYQECLDFLDGATEAPQCDAVFLGPDVGYANIFVYQDEDQSCHLSMAELAGVCAEHYQECLSFLESGDDVADEPECEQVFLGDDIGYASVFEYHDEDRSCHINMQELDELCDSHLDACLAFLGSAGR